MKKLSLFLIGTILMIGISNAQPVSDRAVIPVAITLNQILRLNVTDGGNIEFVFNTIDEYKTGITSADNPQYRTFFNVSSSTPWSLLMYAEGTSMVGTDNPANGIGLDNFGILFATNAANNAFGDQILVTNNATSGGANVVTVGAAAVTYLGCSATSGASNCAGDIVDNNFIIFWEAGTGRGAMNQTSFIDQGNQPDRYVTNAFMDLRTSGI